MFLRLHKNPRSSAVNGSSASSVSSEQKRKNNLDFASKKKSKTLLESKKAVLSIKPFRFLDLPQPLFALVSSCLNQREIAQLNLALAGYVYRNNWTPTHSRALASSALVLRQFPCDFIHRQFKVIPKAGRLLNNVVDADYEKVSNAIDKDPSLMFEPVSFVYSDGSSERISPLKYAFKVYDTYMWMMFYEKIKDNPKWVEQFRKQELEQSEHIDLAPFFAASKEFETQHKCWQRGKISEESDEKNRLAWIKYGAAQHKYLPLHVVKEMAREGDTWRVNSTFDINARPAPSNCRLWDYTIGGYENFGKHWITLSTIIKDRGWGSSYTLFRGETSYCGMHPNMGHGFLKENKDPAIFRRYFAVRKEDLAKQRTLLAQNAHVEQELKNQAQPLDQKLQNEDPLLDQKLQNQDPPSAKRQRLR